MGGDLNFWFINWTEGTFSGWGVTKDREKLQAGCLLDLVEANELENVIKVPTRGKNILDLLLVREEWRIKGINGK